MEYYKAIYETAGICMLQKWCCHANLFRKSTIVYDALDVAAAKRCLDVLGEVVSVLP